jgi:hypothetical protein
LEPSSPALSWGKGGRVFRHVKDDSTIGSRRDAAALQQLSCDQLCLLSRTEHTEWIISPQNKVLPLPHTSHRFFSFAVLPPSLALLHVAHIQTASALHRIIKFLEACLLYSKRAFLKHAQAHTHTSRQTCAFCFSLPLLSLQLKVFFIPLFPP